MFKIWSEYLGYQSITYLLFISSNEHKWHFKNFKKVPKQKLGTIMTELQIKK